MKRFLFLALMVLAGMQINAIEKKKGHIPISVLWQVVRHNTQIKNLNDDSNKSYPREGLHKCLDSMKAIGAVKEFDVGTKKMIGLTEAFKHIYSA